MHATIGDVIEVDRNEVGVPPRRGTIVAVRGARDLEHYEVEWEDGHQSTFFPSSTTHVVRPAGQRS